MNNGEIGKHRETEIESARELYYSSEIGGREPDLDETCQIANHKRKNRTI